MDAVYSEAEARDPRQGEHDTKNDVPGASLFLKRLPGNFPFPVQLFRIELEDPDNLIEIRLFVEKTGGLAFTIFSILKMAGLGWSARGDFFPKHSKKLDEILAVVVGQDRPGGIFTRDCRQLCKGFLDGRIIRVDQVIDIGA